MSDYYAPVDPARLKREREKARELRASAWWKRRISAGICYYCRRAVGVRALTMDHLVPLGRGGRSVRGNLVPACKECNDRKKSSLPFEWPDYLDAPGRGDDE
jgi:5-methylcytosine-specific restriction enzyme A